jgi:hypothetical protein
VQKAPLKLRAKLFTLWVRSHSCKLSIVLPPKISWPTVLIWNLHAWWRKRRRSDRKTSWHHLFLCWRRITGKIHRVLAHVYIGILPEFPSEKLMRYRELCIWCTMVLVLTKSFKKKCVILEQELTENNLRKWKFRLDRCQRRVANKTCRFLIANNIAY